MLHLLFDQLFINSFFNLFNWKGYHTVRYCLYIVFDFKIIWEQNLDFLAFAEVVWFQVNFRHELHFERGKSVDAVIFKGCLDVWLPLDGGAVFVFEEVGSFGVLVKSF